MRRFAMLFAALAFVGAACGSDSDDVAQRDTTLGEGSGRLELVAEDTAFDQTELAADAGALVISFDNRDDGIMHNLHVTGDGVDEKTDIETGPTTQTLELELDAGTYSYTCDVHPQQMKGELTVT